MSLGRAEVIRWIKFGNGGPAVERYRGVITVSIGINCMKDNAEVHVANCTAQINYHTVPLLQACIVLITLIDKRHLDSILGIASVFQNSQLIHPHTPLP
ncbi:4-hydroxy-tetrahydrodipicolinate synthase [Fusarium oxysporum f. sp. albedinis]|nr:4-hydroxy-tetrahydrodipicolinate synthase [Fusarium oxysporum f. sp. albedinis]